MTSSRIAVALLVAASGVVASGCATLAKAAHYERTGSFPMPDVTGMTTDQAKDEIAKAGITGSVEVVDNYVCHDPNVRETLVCTTSPIAGAATSAHLAVTLHTRPVETRSFLMPDVVGMTGDEARDALLKLGEVPARILIETLPGASTECGAARVCRQSPSAGHQAWVTGPVLLQLGAEGSGPRRTQDPPGPPTKPVVAKPETDPRPPTPAKPDPIF